MRSSLLSSDRSNARPIFSVLVLGALAGGALLGLERAEAKPRLPIPSAFHGEWQEQQGDCGTGKGEGALIVRPWRLWFKRRKGDVIQVDWLSRRAVSVAAAYSAGKEMWIATQTLRLSRSRRVLTISDGDTKVTWRRCP